MFLLLELIIHNIKSRFHVENKNNVMKRHCEFKDFQKTLNLFI